MWEVARMLAVTEATLGLKLRRKSQQTRNGMMIAVLLVAVRSRTRMTHRNAAAEK
jgi:hypothetical protein